MDAYKALRNLVLGLGVMAVPYVCERGCAYSTHKAEAAQVQRIGQASENQRPVKVNLAEIAAE